MENAEVSQAVAEVAYSLQDKMTVSQVVVEPAWKPIDHLFVSQVVAEVAFIRTGRYAGPAVQHV